MMRRRMHAGSAGPLALVGFLLLAAACGDTPTAPGAPLGGVPRAARSFLTADQAQDILTTGYFVKADEFGTLTFNAMRGQLSGFNPDIDFIYDAAEPIPNVYAYEVDGRKTVHLTGGLMRLAGFYYEGLLMAMAHGVEVFGSGEPKTSLGQTGVGPADFRAFQTIRGTAWFGSAGPQYQIEAIKQWTALFALVSKEHAAGNPADSLLYPSLPCRIVTIKAGVAGSPLPACAGGPPGPPPPDTSTAGLERARLPWTRELRAPAQSSRGF